MSAEQLSHESLATRMPSRFPLWVLVGALLIPLIYLPTLGMRFDFIDDGNLVYPTPPMPFAQRADVVWNKIVANYEHLGPFRPVLWVHWELAADFLQGSELGWRALKLIWCMFATAMLLWLMAELRISTVGAFLAGAIALWNPYRSEIWTSLTLSEGIAMPYALLTLVAACRATKSPRAWLWDLVGVLSMLAALGCKNTFIALLPAQMFLRLAPDSLTLKDGLRRHGLRAILLSVTFLAPVAHYIYFKKHWHPGQYTVPGPSWFQLRNILSGLRGAVGLDFLGVGLGLVASVLVFFRRHNVAETKSDGDSTPSLSPWWWPSSAIGTGLLLVSAGIVVYLPMADMSPRYTMPGVWGLDLLIAVMIDRLVLLGRSWQPRLAWTALALGLVGIIVSNVGKQQKFAARSHFLWQALDCVRREAPRGATLAWYSGNPMQGDLDPSEAIHFQWHLEGLGRRDLRIAVLDLQGQPKNIDELNGVATKANLALWGLSNLDKDQPWQVRHTFENTFWMGRRHYVCRLGEPVLGTSRQARAE